MSTDKTDSGWRKRQIALDVMAENARELGLDYDPVHPTQRQWVGLTDEDFQPAVQKAMVYYGYEPKHLTLTSGAGFYALVRAIEAKLKEKNT